MHGKDLTPRLACHSDTSEYQGKMSVMMKLLASIEKTDDSYSAYLPDSPGCIAAAVAASV